MAQKTGSSGDDYLVGSEGDDYIAGNDGDDTLYGGEGSDYIFGDAGDDIIGGEGGNDLIGGGAGDDLIGGGAGDDLIAGGQGDDRMYGDAGDDTLRGDSGADVVAGGSGDDVIYGGSGDDVLIGNGERPDLNPGATDFDTFVVKPGEGNDTVLDFNVNEDRIDLSHFNSVTGLADLSIQQQGANAIVSFGAHGGGSLQLMGVDASDLDAGDFIFQGAADADAG